MKRSAILILCIFALTACSQGGTSDDLEKRIEELENINTELENRIEEMGTTMTVSQGGTSDDLEKRIEELENINTELENRIEEMDTAMTVRKNEHIEIYEELEEETISSVEFQDAYEKMDSADDKVFRLTPDGKVYIKNGGEILYFGWVEADDINNHYNGVISKFMNLLNNKRDVITDRDLLDAGFSQEAVSYGILVINSGRDELYKSYCRNYVYRRKALECELHLYETGQASQADIDKAYVEYAKAKKTLQQYIDTTIHGDI